MLILQPLVKGYPIAARHRSWPLFFYRKAGLQKVQPTAAKDKSRHAIVVYQIILFSLLIQ